MSDAQWPPPVEPPTEAEFMAEYERRNAEFKMLRRTSVVGGVLVAVLLVAISFLPVPYVMLSPGPMFNTIGSVDGVDLIKITDTQVYPTSGELNLTTVSERGGPYGELTLPEALVGWLSPEDVVVPTTDLFPEGTTKQDATQENAVDFASSQSNAISAALTHLNIPVTSAVIVSLVTAESPASTVLKVGDQIVAFDGVKITKPTELPPLVRAKKPGSTATFSLVRDGKPLEVDVVLLANPRNANEGYVGVAASLKYSGPFPIEFGVEGVGGSSAGTMFALGIIDKLTPDDLANGEVVAGTGTIGPTGEVGPIGGIEQKMLAAQGEGAKLFLAPKSNCSTVQASTPEGLNVAAVSTLTEAVEVLQKWKAGSTDLPRC